MHFEVKNTFKKQPQPHFQTQLAKHFIHAFLLHINFNHNFY
jgi:hypothetical protein